MPSPWRGPQPELRAAASPAADRIGLQPRPPIRYYGLGGRRLAPGGRHEFRPPRDVPNLAARRSRHHLRLRSRWLLRRRYAASRPGHTVNALESDRVVPGTFLGGDTHDLGGHLDGVDGRPGTRSGDRSGADEARGSPGDRVLRGARPADPGPQLLRLPWTEEAAVRAEAGSGVVLA